jgi:hypothetical protein
MGGGTLLEPDDADWTGALTQSRHDVYHLSGYASLEAERCGGTATAFRYADGDGVLLLPLILRDVPGTDLRDAVSPYGYPGPLGGGDAAFWERACRAMVDLLGEQGVVTAFVRLHPLLPAPAAALAQTGTLVHHGRTVSVDLTLDPEQIWQQTHRTHRNQINKSRRAGVSVVFDDWDRFDAWIDAYHATMRRVGATDFYFFTPEYLHRLRATLGGHVHLAVALAGDEVLGGNLFFEYGGIMHTHLQATRDGPTFWADKLLYHEVRLWGRDRGNVIHHLGGGLGGAADDSLFAYKAAFAAGRHDYHTWRLVTDPAMFEKLTTTPLPEALTGRFPPYR